MAHQRLFVPRPPDVLQVGLDGSETQPSNVEAYARRWATEHHADMAHRGGCHGPSDTAIEDRMHRRRVAGERVDDGPRGPGRHGRSAVVEPCEDGRTRRAAGVELEPHLGHPVQPPEGPARQEGLHRLPPRQVAPPHVFSSHDRLTVAGGDPLLQVHRRRRAITEPALEAPPRHWAQQRGELAQQRVGRGRHEDIRQPLEHELERGGEAGALSRGT